MSAAESLDEAPRLVDLLLAEQRTLRAVDELSSWHETADDHRARFETLIPSVSPGAGRQYAFAVDLDACTGCKACVTACHSLNGLEPGETWRKVGEIEGSNERGRAPAHRQTVTTACHHCESPACLAGCPVRAYEKDASTGIVIHLDDQCIGCRYCQLMCPYDVPQYSERLGIVRKCDMCHGRLAAGEAPACVQGCPNEAISIEVVDSRPAPEARAEMLLPMVPGDMPRSALTWPTTRYRTKREGLPVLRVEKGFDPQPSEGHTPLAVMLVLTQGSIGALLFDLALSAATPSRYGPSSRLVLLLVAAVLGFGGLGASVLHLGRPQWAVRAVLGLGSSWMSREIVAFGAFAASLLAALCATTAVSWGPWIESGDVVAQIASFDRIARASALASGLAGLFCSVKIYAVTGRPLWRADRTALRFGGTAGLLGAGVAALAASVGRVLSPESAGGEASLSLALPALVLALALAKLRWERGMLVHGEAGHDDAALERTRRLFGRALASRVRLRRALGLVGGAALPIAALALAAVGESGLGNGLLLLLVLLGSTAGELVERSLFFRGEAMRGMPGSP